MHSLKEIVKGTTAKLSHINNGKLYFNVDVEGIIYQFPIDCTDVSEWKDTDIYTEYKAVTLMRWIRKAMESQNLIQLNINKYKSINN